MRMTILAAGLAVLALAGSASSEMAVTLPPFELPTLAGDRISDLDLQGTTLLLFMLPDSEACATGLQLVQSTLAGAAGITAAIVVPEAGDPARDLVERESITWPVILDEAFLLASIFSIGSVPTVCLLQDGALVGRLGRGFTADELSAALVDPFGTLEQVEGNALSAEGVRVGFMKLVRPLLLMFAGAECGLCHHMLPSVFEIAEELDTCIVITEELVQLELFESNASRLSVVLDPHWGLASVFDIPTVPTIFLIDRDGTIVWSHTGIIEGLGIVAHAFLQRYAQSD